MFFEGSHIPLDFHVDFARANGGDLPVMGQGRDIDLLHNGQVYQAKLVHGSRPDTGSARLFLQYSSGSPFAALLRGQLAFSYRTLVGERRDPPPRPEDIPPADREYVEFYATGQPYRYTVRLVPRTTPAAPAPDWAPPARFADVWADLGRRLGARAVVHTLAEGRPTTVSWLGEQGIQVSTGQGQDLLPQAWFAATWQRLAEQGILAADEFPADVCFRSATVATLLVQLPYVEYTTYPRTTLFLKAHPFTNAQLAATFKVGTQRGIRVAGRAPDTKLVVFITGEGTEGKPDHPYRDRWEGETFYYTGEGLQGPQQMTHGNLALQNNITQYFPVFGFQKRATGGYQYLGRFKVKAVQTEEQPDDAGNRRTVFVFAMARVAPGQGNPAAAAAPELPPRELPYLHLAAPRTPAVWADAREQGFLFLEGWDALGDLRTYPTQAALAQAVAAQLGAAGAAVPSLVRRRAEELWLVREVVPGSRILVHRGAGTVLGAATASAGYRWRPERAAARHAIPVRWESLGARRVPRQRDWALALAGVVTPDLHAAVVAKPVPAAEPRPDLAAVVQSFAAALRLGGISFGPRHEETVRAFVASLATKPFVILTGMSGAGKTQIALRFGDWLGPQRRLVVPVRPDWTGPDALFGYEDALRAPCWHVPEVLAFLLRAARDPDYPYLLILDEMNLAHVERYFADFLSGMESGEDCLPNLVRDDQGHWRLAAAGPAKLPIPDNLFVVGTVNVDETTYMFSPKVLDRANTFEFRVRTDDLTLSPRKPLPLEPGADDLVRGFLAVATAQEWQEEHPAPGREEFAQQFRQLHQVLSATDFAFGHRVFYEALRYASMLAAAGNPAVAAALDQQVYQKVLPRLHGSRQRLEPTLRALGRFCWALEASPADPFDPEAPGEGAPRLPLSFDKVRRMFRSLRANQFASFSE